MSVSESFRAYVLDQLGRAVPRLRSRRMFGAVGCYAADTFFAIIADDALYFKADDANRPDYEARGMEPFRPYGPDGEIMQYYQVPEDVIEDVEGLQHWADRAIAVARAKKRRPQRAKRR